MSTHYPEAVKKLLKACEDFRAEDLGLDDLKSAVWETASVIVSVEEVDFRLYLQAAEGRLDMIQFTAERVWHEALKIVAELEARAQSHLKNVSSLRQMEDDSIPDRDDR